jgi:hypothetical protein
MFTKLLRYFAGRYTPFAPGFKNRNMKLYSIIEAVLILLTCCVSFSQSDSLTEVMPLSVGNRWTYRYYTSIWDNSDITITDSGLAVYTIITSFPEQDSTRWIFGERRNLNHCIHYYFNQRPDTCWSTIDSTSFEIIEVQSGRHRLYRNESEETIWQSVFPWSRDVTDTVAIYRYSVVDSAGLSTFETHSVIQRFVWVYDLAFKNKIGQTATSAQSGDRFVGAIFNSDHLLVSSVINSAHDRSGNYLPTFFALGQNYPNPFNPSTKIPFQLSSIAWVTLRVYNSLGELVTTLLDDRKTPGYYEVEWSPTLSSGVYYFELQIGSHSQTKKSIYLR